MDISHLLPFPAQCLGWLGHVAYEMSGLVRALAEMIDSFSMSEDQTGSIHGGEL